MRGGDWRRSSASDRRSLSEDAAFSVDFWAAWELRSDEHGSAMAEYTPWNPETAGKLLAAKAGLDGPLTPILHALNETFGHVPDEAVPLIADTLNISRAEVHGTLTFYHDFRREPAPRHV